MLYCQVCLLWFTIFFKFGEGFIVLCSAKPGLVCSCYLLQHRAKADAIQRHVCGLSRSSWLYNCGIWFSQERVRKISQWPFQNNSSHVVDFIRTTTNTYTRDTQSWNTFELLACKKQQDFKCTIRTKPQFCSLGFCLIHENLLLGKENWYEFSEGISQII